MMKVTKRIASILLAVIFAVGLAAGSSLTANADNVANPAGGAVPNIHIHAPAGYTFVMYFNDSLGRSLTPITIKIPANGLGVLNSPPLDGSDVLDHIEVINSNGDAVRTIGPEGIDHRNDKSAIFEDEGSFFGAHGTIEMNTGTANFWYTAPTGSITLGTKTVVNDLMRDGQFRFEVYDNEGLEGLPVATGRNLAGPAGSTRNITGLTLSFNTDFQATGDHDYWVKEIVPADPGDWDMDTHVFHVVVTVAEDSNSTALSVTVKSVDGETLADNPINFTNTYLGHQDPSLIAIPVTKVWRDHGGVSNNRPANGVKVQLLADGQLIQGQEITLTAPGWSDYFVDLPEFEPGSTTEKIVYTVEESTVPGYYPGRVTGNMTDGFTITNTERTTNVRVNKVWVDGHNINGNRPEDGVTVTLVANGEETDQTVTLDSSNHWRGMFRDLPVYINGDRARYTVKETPVPDAYDSDVTGSVRDGFTVTNTEQTLDIPVTKVWDDNNNAKQIRPDSVTVNLLSRIVDTGDFEVVPDTELTLSDDNGWTDTFKALPAYKDGQALEYTVQEASVPEGYASLVKYIDPTDTAIGYYEIDNSYTGPQTGSTTQPTTTQPTPPYVSHPTTVQPTTKVVPGSGAPQTGDPYNQALWLVLMLIGAATVAVVVRGKKRANAGSRK